MDSIVEYMESIAEYMEQKHSTWNPPGMWGQGKVLQQSHVCQNGSEWHSVYLPYHIGVRWGSTKQFGMATL